MTYTVNICVNGRKLSPEELKKIKLNSETADRVINYLKEQQALLEQQTAEK